MYTSSVQNSRYIYLQVIAIYYAQLLSHCTSNAYRIRIAHPSDNNQQSVFNQYNQPNDHKHSNDRFEPNDPAFGVEDVRRIRKSVNPPRQTKTMPPLNEIAFNSQPDPFLDNHYFEDFRKLMPNNENKFHKQSKEVHKFHTHVSRIDENSNNNNIDNNGMPQTKTNTGHHNTYDSDQHHRHNNNHNHRKHTETVDNDGYDKNVDFKFVADFPSERLIKSDDFFDPNSPTTTVTPQPATDSRRLPKKSSFDYDDTIEIEMNKHTDEPDELKTEVTNHDDVTPHHGDHINQLKSRLNHVSTDPNVYQHNSRINHESDSRPIYDDNQPKNFEDRYSLDPRTHINNMLNYFNSYPSTELIDHNSNGDSINNNHEHNQNIRHHIEAYPHHYADVDDNSGNNDDNHNRFNEFESRRQRFDDNPHPQSQPKRKQKQQKYGPWVQEITKIIPSDEQSYLFKPIDEPSPPTLPDIDLFIEQNNRKKPKQSPKMKRDENFYDDFDEMPRQRDEEQTKKQVERELSRAAPISQYTPQEDSDKAGDEKNVNTGDSDGRIKPTNFEKEVDISSADLENYFDKEFASFHSDKDPIETNKPEQEDSEEPPVTPTLIPSHIYRDHEQEDVLPEQPKVMIHQQIRKTPHHNDQSDNEGSRRSEKTEQELDEQEPDYRTSADFLRDHDDFLKKIDNENEKFKKESDEKGKQQEEDEQEEGSDDNDNENGENKKQVDDGEKELDNDDSDAKQDGESDDSDDTADDSKVNKNKHESKQQEDKQQDNAEEEADNNNNEAKEDKQKNEAAADEDDETEDTKEEAVENDSTKTDSNDSDNNEDNKNDDTAEEETKKVESKSKDKKKPVKQKKNEVKAVMALVKSIKDKNTKCQDMDKCYDKLNDIAETKESNIRDHSPIVVPKAPKVPANLPKKVLFMQTSIVSKALPASHSKQRLLATETNTISTPITTQIAVPLTVTVASNSRHVNGNADTLIGVTQSPDTFDLKRITSAKKSALNLFDLPVSNQIQNRRTTRDLNDRKNE